MAGIERNKEVVRRWVEDAWGKADPDLQDELLHPDVVDHNPFPGMPPGIEGQKMLLRLYTSAFDIRSHCEQLLADGDHVIARNRNRLTHKAEFMGIPATGKTAEMMGVDICRLEDGKIKEFWHLEDSLGLMQQLGLIPAFRP